MVTGSEGDPVRGRGEAVLAVDDVAIMRRMLVRQLSDLGYRVVEAENAASALAALESEPVDLLLTDIMMTGGKSGFDLARTARERWPNLRIVFTSGFSDRRLKAEGGFADAPMIQKPFRREELARVLRAALDAPL